MLDSRPILLALLVTLTTTLACSSLPPAPPSGAAAGASSTAAPSPARARLETTPRHDEWVRIERAGRALHAYVSYPQVAAKAPAIVVIHENRGLNDWARAVADRLAEHGFIAVAPDLLSGMAPGGGKTGDFPSEDAAREAISGLPPAQVAQDLQAAADFASALPAADGTLFVAGFCWGGGRAFEFANARPELAAAFVFYGTGPQDAAGAANVTAPVYGFYGGNDARVNATVDQTAEVMRAAGKRFEPVIYDGAGHGFLRAGEAADASPENRRAYDQAWQRWLELLRSGG